MFLLVQTYSPRSVPKGRNRPLEEFAAEKKSRKAPAVKVGSFKLGLKSWVIYPLAILLIAALLMAANSYHERLPLKEIQVSVVDGAEHPFIDAAGVKTAMGEEGDSVLVGQSLNRIALDELETKLLENPFIKSAEVYKNFSGVLTAEVGLKKPMARLINNDGEYLYLDEQGAKFPDSDLHSAHVLLIRGNFEEEVVDTFACSTIKDAIPVAEFIYQDPFWNAQISDIVVRQSGELELIPQVGELNIQFGYPVRIEEKFDLLMDFYRQVIPKVGWKHYRSVSLKFKGQVVAKRR